MFGKPSRPWAIPALKSLLFALLFFVVGIVFRGIVAFGHRDRRVRDSKR
jgi:hypothetical protein